MVLSNWPTPTTTQRQLWHCTATIAAEKTKIQWSQKVIPVHQQQWLKTPPHLILWSWKGHSTSSNQTNKQRQQDENQREREYVARQEQLTNNEKWVEAKWAFVEKEKKKIARAIKEANELVDEKERRAIEVDKQTNKKKFELFETKKNKRIY
jgi:hypothetical protein